MNGKLVSAALWLASRDVCVTSSAFFPPIRIGVCAGKGTREQARLFFLLLLRLLLFFLLLRLFVVLQEVHQTAVSQLGSKIGKYYLSSPCVCVFSTWPWRCPRCCFYHRCYLFWPFELALRMIRRHILFYPQDFGVVAVGIIILPAVLINPGFIMSDARKMHLVYWNTSNPL